MKEGAVFPVSCELNLYIRVYCIRRKNLSSEIYNKR